MKVLNTLLMVCAAALLFAGCTKDNTETNQITFGKETTAINVGPCGLIQENHQVGGPGYHFDCDFTLQGIECHIFIHVSAALNGKKADLGSTKDHVAYSFEINSSYESHYLYDVHQYCTEYSGWDISHSSAGTWFKSGTMDLKDDGKKLVFNVNGTLEDGREFKMNITTESKKFE